MGRHLKHAGKEYRDAHDNLADVLGLARDHMCCRCGAQALHWAYDHKDPAERREPVLGLAYSLDVDHYVPMCASCHARFDWDYRESARLAPVTGR